MPGNYLRFVSDPLSESCEFNGSFIASLNAIVNKKDMDLSIKLYEQMPDGRYFQLSNNIARCSFIKDFSKRRLLTTGRLENIFLSHTFFTSRYLQKGSRIILLVGINNNPYWQINYGTGKDVSKETIDDAKTPLQIQWFTNSSYIKLPIWK
jgi:predicted acyl esterase